MFCFNFHRYNGRQTYSIGMQTYSIGMQTMNEVETFSFKIEEFPLAYV